MSKPGFSPLMAKLLRSIDRNTRAIAKVCSAADYVCDELDNQDEKNLFREILFALIQERRNLKTQFEDEWKRLQ